MEIYVLIFKITLLGITPGPAVSCIQRVQLLSIERSYVGG